MAARHIWSDPARRPRHCRGRNNGQTLGAQDQEWEWAPGSFRTGVIFDKDTTTALDLAPYKTQFRSNTLIGPLADATTQAAFHKFPELLSEIRLKIWRLALVPRLVGVELVREYNHDGENAGEDRIVSNNPVPVLLHVSFEARSEALKAYSLHFATPTAPATTYFDPTRDTLLIQKSHDRGSPANLVVQLSVAEFLLAGVNKSEASQLRSVAISTSLLHSIPGDELGIFKDFASLKEVIVVDGVFDVSTRSIFRLAAKLWPQWQTKMKEDEYKELLKIEPHGPKITWRVPSQVVLQ